MKKRFTSYGNINELMKLSQEALTESGFGIFKIGKITKNINAVKNGSPFNLIFYNDKDSNKSMVEVDSSEEDIILFKNALLTVIQSQSKNNNDIISESAMMTSKQQMTRKEKKEEDKSRKKNQKADKRMEIYDITDLPDEYNAAIIRITNSLGANKLISAGTALSLKNPVDTATLTYLESIIEQNFVIMRQLQHISDKLDKLQ